MRIFFIAFAFIVAISAYPKIASLYASSGSIISAKGSLIADNKKTTNNLAVQSTSATKKDYNSVATPKKAVVLKKPNLRRSEDGEDDGEGEDDGNYYRSYKRSYKKPTKVYKKTIKKQNLNSSSKHKISKVTHVSKKKYVSKYKDGSYTGKTADAYYGYVQTKVTIKNGKISDVKFLKYPNSSQNSVYLNGQALPYLRQEVIKVQDGKVDAVSGATYTSMAFMQSTKSALLKALN